MTSSGSQQGNKPTGRVGSRKNLFACLDGVDAGVSRNRGGPQKSVVAKVKPRSVSKEENCRAWEGPGKLVEHVNQKAVCPQQHKITVDGRKARMSPSGTCEQDRNSCIERSCRRGGPTAAVQSRTQQKHRRHSTCAWAKRSRGSNHPYKTGHWASNRHLCSQELRGSGWCSETSTWKRTRRRSSSMETSSCR